MNLKELIKILEETYDDCRCVDTDVSLECLIKELKDNGLDDINDLESDIDDINLGGSL